MAVTVSGLYVGNWIDAMDASQLAIDLDLETHKGALLSNSATPNFSTDVQWTNSNEVTGTNWATGGVALTGTTYTESPTGSAMFDATDVSVATTTISAARAYRLYETALGGGATKALIVLVNFGADYSTSAGTFGIQWAATGIFAIDLTP